MGSMLPPTRLPTRQASPNQAGNQEKAPKLQWREDVAGLSPPSDDTISISRGGMHVQGGRAATTPQTAQQGTD